MGSREDMKDMILHTKKLSKVKFRMLNVPHVYNAIYFISYHTISISIPAHVYYCYEYRRHVASRNSFIVGLIINNTMYTIILPS